MLCPTCRERIDPRVLACGSGHAFRVEDGVLVLLDESFGHRLSTFMEAFVRMRARDGMRILDEEIYDRLPFAEVETHRHEWALRRYDWEVVRRLVARYGRGRRILDVGAWNGWLSNRLTAEGHEVTAVDYFADPHDGLGAMRFYPRRWRAIQMDLRDLGVLEEEYDVVVLNRCTQFFDDPAALVREAIARLVPGGLLVMTGLPFYRDPGWKREQMRQLRARLQRHGTDFFTPVRGYLDAGDRARLADVGVVLSPYRRLWRSNLRARWMDGRKPFYAYGVLQEGAA